MDGFWSLVESTLEVRYLRGGNYRTVLADGMRSHPHTVIGQVVGNGLRTLVAGRGRFDIAPGSGYCIPAGVRRRTANRGGRPALFHWAHFELRLAGGIDLARLIDLPLVLPPATGRRIGAINRRLLEIHEAGSPDLQAVVERKRLGLELLELLLAAVDPAEMQAGERLRHLGRIQPVLRGMGEHLADPLSVPRLARQVGLAP